MSAGITELLWTLLGMCLALLAYTYLGYPALLFVLRTTRARPSKRETCEPVVSLIIAARNEEAAISDKLNNALKLDYPREKLEIIVASDGSTDRTDEIVSAYADHGVVLFHQAGHIGKTESTNRVVPTTRGEILFFSDATGKWREDALRAMVRSFADAEVGAVSGRVVYQYPGTASASGFQFYQRLVVAARRAETSFGTETSVSGAIHALRRSVFTPAPRDLDFDMVHPLHVAERGLRTVYENDAVCVEEARRDVGDEFRARSRMAIQAYSFLPYLLRRLSRCRNRMYVFQVLSHKVARWISPHVLALALVLSVALARDSQTAMVFLLAQLAVYLGAVLGWLGQRFRYRIPGLSVPLFFVLINLAFLVGFWGWLRGERRGAWTPNR